MAAFWVYILQCNDGSLYTGIAADVEKRFAMHRAGKGARYTASHPPERILYRQRCTTRSGATKRETQIKSWPRKKKLALIKNKRGG